MSNYVVSLDFGTSKIAIAVGEKRDSGIEIVSYHEAVSDGVLYGEIVREQNAVETVRDLVAKAQMDISESIRNVTVGISGKFIHSKTVTCLAKRDLPDNPITQEEINKLISERYSEAVADGEIVFEAIPQKYSIDDINGLTPKEIIGMSGSTIEATFKIFCGKADILNRRRRVLKECRLNLKKTVISSVASARAVLTEQEAENGAVLVDIGKGLTEVAIVKDNIVRDIAVIPFAGESVTADIKSVTAITSKWSEAVKIQYGSCCSDFTAENKKLILHSDDNRVEGEVELSLLSNVIESRVSEIFDAVRYIVDKAGYSDKIPGGVVITGGSAYLEYISQLAGAILGQKARLAAPMASISDSSNDNAFNASSSTVVGLVLEDITPIFTPSAGQREAEKRVERKPFTGTLDFGEEFELDSRRDTVTENPVKDVAVTPAYVASEESYDEDDAIKKEQEVIRRREEEEKRRHKEEKEEEKRRKKEEKEEEKRRKKEEKRRKRESREGLILDFFNEKNDEA